MRLITLKLHNFRQHRDTEVNFLDGITGIIGANGAGKTTLLESIAWALYGQKAVRRMDRGTADMIRSRGTAGTDPAEVSLVFEMGGQAYTVVRREHDASMLAEGRKLHTGTSQVTDAVCRLLSMDQQQFFSSFFTGQKDLTFLKDINNADRQAHIAKLLGYDRLARARKLVNDDKLAAEKDAESMAKGLGSPDDIRERIATAKSASAAANQKLSGCEKNHEQAQALLAQLEPKLADALGLEKKYSAASAEIALLETRKKQSEENLAQVTSDLAEIAALEREAADLKAAADEFERLRARNYELQELRVDHELGVEKQAQADRLARTISEESTKVEQLRKGFAALAESKAAEQAAQKLQAEARSALAALEQAWTRDRARAESDERAHRTQAQKVREHLKQLEQAGPEGICPTCERPLLGEFVRVTDSMRAEIAESEAGAAEAKARLDALRKEPEQVAGARSSLEAAETRLRAAQSSVGAAEEAGRSLQEHQKLLDRARLDLGKCQTELASLRSGYDKAEEEAVKKRALELKPKRERAQQLLGKLADRPKQESRREALEAALRELTGQLESKRKELQELGFDAGALRTLQEQHRQAKQSADAAIELRATARAESAAASASLKQAQEEMARYEERAKGLSERRERALYLACLVGAFDRLRQDLNAEIRPRLAQFASELLCQVTDGRFSRLDLGEDYKPQLFYEDGEICPVISGGEEDVAHLVVRIAISQMIAQEAGVDLGLLILDEAFASLDAMRRSRVIELLQNLRGTFGQILLITHIEDIHDLVDRCLWVSCDPDTQSSIVSDSTPLPDASDIAREAAVAI